MTAGARVLATVRSDAAGELRARARGRALADDGFAEAVLAKRRARRATSCWSWSEAPFPGNLDALALRGRIVVVSVAAGSNVEMPLLALMPSA